MRSLRLIPKRRYVFVAVLAITLILSYGIHPAGRMVAVNRTDQAESVRLTMDSGGNVEYQLPPMSAVVLPAPDGGTVTGAVIFDDHCLAIIGASFGPRVFGAGGQIYNRGLHDAGFTTDRYDGVTQAAVAGSTCVGVTLPSP